MTQNVCIYQDNPDHYVSVQLAVLSLAEHEPLWTVHVFIPSCPAWLAGWLADKPRVRLDTRVFDGSGWSVKPKVIGALLDTVEDDVLWLDSDILLTRPLSPLLQRFPSTALVLAEDPQGDWPRGTKVRTEGWGLKTGRVITENINTCVVRAARGHRALIAAWIDLVDDSRYRHAQTLHWSIRPCYFFGDQDVLSALLGSNQFADVSVVLLSDGKDIASCLAADTYAWRDRLMNWFGQTPALVHAQGEKPWMMSARPCPVYHDVSPYKILARQYSGAGLAATDWLAYRTIGGQLLSRAFLGERNLVGVLPAMVARFQRRANGFIKLGHDYLGFCLNKSRCART